MPPWILLVTNLPGRDQTLRMRLWRGLKAAGAASLRDGVYLLPGAASAQEVFETHAAEIRLAGGSAYVVGFDAQSKTQMTAFLALFDRAAEYGQFIARLTAFRRKLTRLKEPAARRGLEVLRRELAQVVGRDFFTGASRPQAEAALTETVEAVTRRFSPDEPHARQGAIVRLDIGAYQGRTWATREHLWIDRVSSAWLIRRFIDPKAKFRWLKRVKDCPKNAVGFDFDGAEFSHVDHKVTFEVLIASFGLEQDHGLARLGGLVHYLDVGGAPVPEAAGLAAIVTGARALHSNDDALLGLVTPTLDSLYAAYSVADEV
jgi:hypothetical protein